MKKARKILFFGNFLLLFLGGIFLYQQSRFGDGKLHVIFCDVGQGDSILIRSPKGMDILVDGGPDDSVLSCLSNNMPFWDRTIELMILSHPHEDHYGGLISVLKRYSVLSFYTEKAESETQGYKKLKQVLTDNKIISKTVWAGDRFNLKDGVVLKTLWPEYGSFTGSNKDLDKNGFSLVSLLTYNKFSVLLTGDAGVVVWDKIGDKLVPVDVLKVPHHGSKTGMDREFLNLIRPKLAVISVGKNNRYGHPAKQALDLLKEFSIKILRTDMDGEVELVSDGKVAP